MYPYRVFVSYSRQEKRLAQTVQEHLVSDAIGACPMSDREIWAGTPFDEDIARQISFAHVFIPILTSASETRPWVHQEIGYAMGLGVPILPLALDELPKGMAERIQAVKVRPDLSDLGDKLTSEALDRVVSSSQKKSAAMFRCGDRLYERTKILV